MQGSVGHLSNVFAKCLLLCDADLGMLTQSAGEQQGWAFLRMMGTARAWSGREKM